MIAFDTANSKIDIFSGGPAEVQNIALTIGANDNRLLCVLIKVAGSTSPTNVRWSTGTQDYTMDGGYEIDNGGDGKYWFFYLLNPEATSGNVKITVVASVVCYTTAAVYYNAEQVAPDSTTFLLDTGSGTTWTLSNTTTDDNSWLVGATFTNSTVTHSTSTGTERTEANIFSAEASLSDNGPITPAGSSTIEGGLSSSVAWYGISIVITPIPSAPIILARPIYFK